MKAARPIVASAITVLVLCSGTLVGQTRTQKPVAADFPAKTQEANVLFAKQEFSSAIKKLQEAIQIAVREIEKRLDAAMPKAPEPFVRQKQRAAANPLLGVGLMMNTPSQFKWRGKGGDHLKVVVHRESAMVKTMSYAFALAGQNPNQEVIGYKEHKGLFKKLGSKRGFEMMITLWGKHLIQINARGLSEEAFFAMFNQAFVDAVAKILGR